MSTVFLSAPFSISTHIHLHLPPHTSFSAFMAQQPTCPPGVICLSSSLVAAIVLLLCISSAYLYFHAPAPAAAPAPLPLPLAAAARRAPPPPTTPTSPPKLHVHISTPPQAPPPPPPTVTPPAVVLASHDSTAVYEPPLRQDPRRLVAEEGIVGVAINVPTRGPTPAVQQVGILTTADAAAAAQADRPSPLALFGRPTFRGSSKWTYFTATDKFHAIKLPVHCGRRDCTDDLGCDELYDGDEVDVPAYPGATYKATIYALDAPRYIPYL